MLYDPAHWSSFSTSRRLCGVVHLGLHSMFIFYCPHYYRRPVRLGHPGHPDRSTVYRTIAHSGCHRTHSHSSLPRLARVRQSHQDPCHYRLWPKKMSVSKRTGLYENLTREQGSGPKVVANQQPRLISNISEPHYNRTFILTKILSRSSALGALRLQYMGSYPGYRSP